MTGWLRKLLPLGVFGSLVTALVVPRGAAQEPIPLLPPQNAPRLNDPDLQPQPLPTPGQKPGEDIEVLAKGPVHEAFAATAEPPVPSPIIAKQPPDPVEELPPDQKPEGENVQWIPGYWQWDDDASRYIWVSGFWRQPPPGRVWVPGAWRQVNNGWQWIGGFWQPVNPLPQANPNLAQVQPEIQYLPEPPASLESGPVVPAPGASYFYAPGSWVWRGRYLWRPGVWVAYRPGWIWVPARFYWTPAGYVSCAGYWDYPLARRGVLFAPVAFTRPIYARPAFVFTPTFVVSEPCMIGALFVRRGSGGYYFGDYFDRRYVTRGYNAWCGAFNRNGFNIGFGVGRSWGYDPLWSYYSVAFRGTPAWQRGVGQLYHGRYRGDLVRPPTTLVQQNTTINRITNLNVTNVTNTIRVVNGAPMVNNRNVANVAMVAPLKVAPDLQQTRFRNVNADTRRSEAATARQFHNVAVQRTRLEANAALPTQSRSIRLEMPKAAVARAQIRDEKRVPPPVPHHTGPATKRVPKFDPRPTPQAQSNPDTHPGGRPVPKGDLHKGNAPKERTKPPVAVVPSTRFPLAATPVPKVVHQPQMQIRPRPVVTAPTPQSPKARLHSHQQKERPTRHEKPHEKPRHDRHEK